MPISEERKAYNREYHKARYHRIRNEAITKLGGKCVDCGATENLEFDHVDRDTKSFFVGRKMTYPNTEEELKKCVLRCDPCHNARTLEQLSVDHGSGVAGKMNCKCDLCKAKKAEYMCEWHRLNKLKKRLTTC